MNGKIKLPIVAAGLAAALALSASPVLADPQFSTAEVRVDLSGIDLTSTKGRSALESRVKAAINALCGQPVFGTRDEAEALDLCRADARAEAEPKMQQAIARATTSVASMR